MAGRDLSGARVLVAGASGALGGQLVDALLEKGATVVAAGRDEERLAQVAGRTGHDPVTFDAVDVDSCAAAVDAAAATLGGIDVLVVTVGVPGFGRALTTEAAVTEELFAVNVLGPMAVVRAADRHLAEGATVAVFSAVLADLPTAGMADYSAAKSALSTWLQVLRREERRRLTVLDVRPPHLDTGLETRALAGEPPRLPEGVASAEVVATVVAALESGASEIVVDKSGLVTR